MALNITGMGGLPCAATYDGPTYPKLEPPDTGAIQAHCGWS